MENRPHTGETVGASIEEVAEWLSVAEGRPVTIHEVRRIEAQALRKLRQRFRERGLFPANLLSDR